MDLGGGGGGRGRRLVKKSGIQFYNHIFTNTNSISAVGRLFDYGDRVLYESEDPTAGRSVSNFIIAYL